MLTPLSFHQLVAIDSTISAFIAQKLPNYLKQKIVTLRLDEQAPWVWAHYVSNVRQLLVDWPKDSSLIIITISTLKSIHWNLNFNFGWVVIPVLIICVPFCTSDKLNWPFVYAQLHTPLVRAYRLLENESMKNVVSSVLSVALAFNFDTNQPYIKEGPSGSNFGYAVGNFKFSDNRETLIVRHGYIWM